MDSVVREIFAEYPDNVLHYEALLASKGNMETVFGSGNGNLSEIVDNPDFSNPGIAFDDVTVKALFNEAEKHIGKRYVFGANGPNNLTVRPLCVELYPFGSKNMPRTTAWEFTKLTAILYLQVKQRREILSLRIPTTAAPYFSCRHLRRKRMMIHAGDPIRFVSINTPYWREHFYGFGRVNKERTVKCEKRTYSSEKQNSKVEG